MSNDKPWLFKPGQSGNPSGLPANATKFRRITEKTVKATAWKEIVIKAVDQARHGDAKAREWLSDRIMGKVSQFMDVTSGNEPINFGLDKLSDEELTKIGEIVESTIERNDQK